MKTFLMTVLVVQSGQSPEDAKAVLEMNLSEVLPPNDFEVITVAVEVPEQASFKMTERM